MTNNSFLNQLSTLLILKNSSLNLGLLNGKMGVILFFYHYYSFTGNPVYKSYAEELVGDLYEDLTNSYDSSFGNGLAGIGWGIGYLISHNWVEAEEDIFYDFDQKVIQQNVKYINDFSLETGLTGIAWYVLERCQIQDSTFLSNYEEFVKDLLFAMKKGEEKDTQTSFLIQSLEALLQEIDINIPPETLWHFLLQHVQIDELAFTHPNYPVGILENGYTAMGLKMIGEDKQ